MPLIQSKSKKAFSKNVEKEMESGKPQAQALAIAYGVKRKNQKKKMADGGQVEKKPTRSPAWDNPDSASKMQSGVRNEETMNKIKSFFGMKQEKKKMAEGGIVEAIMEKRKNRVPEGMADLQLNGEEEGSSPYDNMNHEAVMKELYDLEQLDDQPEDSNLKDVEIESDAHDMVEQIRRKYQNKKGR